MNFLKRKTTISWILRIVCSIILLQTLFFKFTGAQESQMIFSELGVEPWGRIASGILELIAVVLLLIPKTIRCGAWMIVVIMVGAILSHLFVLGIVVQDDGGLLFILALVTLASALGIIQIHRKT